MPTRMIFLTPSMTSSSITIAADGQPIPLACTETRLALERAGEAEHPALGVPLHDVGEEGVGDVLARGAGRRGGGRLRRSRRGWHERGLACAEIYVTACAGDRT